MAGYFNTAGGAGAKGIAKWNGNAWSPLGSGIDGSVSALAVAGEKLYAGGSFNRAGGVDANGIAEWNGSQWNALGSGIVGTVSDLVIWRQDLYVGGGFAMAGGIPVSNIAKWNGSEWTPLGSGPGGQVSSLAASGARLCAGVDFYPNGNLAEWDGSNWRMLGSGMNGAVWSLAILGTDLYVGGGFTIAAGKVSPFLARVNLGPAIPEIQVEQPDGMNLASGSSTVGFTVRTPGASNTKRFTIRNSGTADLAGLEIRVNGLNGSDFTVGPLATTTLIPGASTTFDVTFTASSYGPRTAGLQIASNDPDGPVDISLLGIISVGRSFAKQNHITIPPVGNASTQLAAINVTGIEGVVSSVRLKVNGLSHPLPEDLDIFVISPSGAVCVLMADAGGYSAVSANIAFDDTAQSAIPDQGAIVSGTYLPANYSPGASPPSGVTGPVYPYLFGLASGTVNGSWRIYVRNYGAGSGSIDSWEVTIEAANPNVVPEISVQQPAGTELTSGSAIADFGPVTVGAISAPKTFTIRNAGTDYLTITELTKSGGSLPDFAINSSGASTVISPGRTTSFTISFSPQITGTRSTTLRIGSNDRDENPFEITLLGTGLAAPADVKAGDLFENFTEATISPLLKQTFPPVYQFDGVATNVENIRDYVLTTARDYLDTDFSMTLTYSLPESGGESVIVFAGIGEGTPDLNNERKPVRAAYLRCEPDDLHPPGDSSSGSRASVVLEDGDSATPEKSLPLGQPGSGIHRLRITKRGDALTFAIDENSSSGPFTAEFAKTLSVSTDLPFLNASNSHLFFGTQSGATFDDLEIRLLPLPASLVIRDLEHTYNGVPKSVSVETNPAGLSVNTTYNGAAQAPTLPGIYEVVATVNDDQYAGTATAILQISKLQQTIAFERVRDILFTTTPIELSASSDSGLEPIAFSVVSGPATVYGGSLTLTGSGMVTVRASHPGNSVYAPAFTEQTFAVGKPPPTDVKAGALSEDFNGATISALLLQPFPPLYRFGGAATNVENTRDYLRTAASDFLETDFTMTLTYSLPFSGGESAVVFAGIGLGAPDAGNQRKPTCAAYLQCEPNDLYPNGQSSLGGQAFLVIDEGDPAVPAEIKAAIGQPGSGTHRIQITRAGDSLTFAIDADSSGGPFTPDFAETLSVSTDLPFLNSTNGHLFFGAQSGATFDDLEIKLLPRRALVNLRGLDHIYDGTSKSALVETEPPGLSVGITYNGAVAAPQIPGSYEVIATVDDEWYSGAATATLRIAKRPQTISFDRIPNTVFTNTPIKLSASSDSGLEPMVFSRVSGPAILTGDSLTLTGSGVVTVRASQAGDLVYAAAYAEQTFQVGKIPQSIIFDTIPMKNFSRVPFTVTAGSSSGLPIMLEAVGGPVLVNGSQVTMTGLGVARISARQWGNATVAAAAPVEQSFKIIDSEDPKLNPAKTRIWTTSSKVKITCSVTDNHVPKAVQYRVKAPEHRFGPWKTHPMPGTKSKKTASWPVAVGEEGSYTVEVRPIDAATNSGKVTKITVIRK